MSSASRKNRQKDIERRYEKERLRNVMAQPGPNLFIIVLDSLKAGFNVPKIFRSAEAFGVAEIHLINVGTFDPAPAKGSFRKVPARFHNGFESCYSELRERGYRIYRMDPQAPERLGSLDLPEKCAFVFGHEEWGFSFEPRDFPEVQPLSIQQYGQIESLNVSIAASIVMYEYARQHGRPSPGV